MASLANMALVLDQLDCDCQPYTQVKTYRQWQAVGMQVRRGEHGIKVLTFSQGRDENGDPNGKKYPKGASVFCLCQVDPSRGVE